MTVGFEFLDRVRKTAALSALFVSLILTGYTGLPIAGAFLLGCAWSLVNIYVITLLVRLTFSDSKNQRVRIALVLFVKVPALYAAGYLLLVVGIFPTTGLMMGFAWPLLIVALKAAGRLLLGLDNGNDPVANTESYSGKKGA